MGAWSTAILGNDTSCEIRDRFIELHDLGEDPQNIAKIILEEQKDNLQYDRTNVWFGLALVCWEYKVLTDEIFQTVKKIVHTKEDIIICKKLGADDKFLKSRQKVLDSFILKISTPKEKAKARKKTPIQIESSFSVGQCRTYKNSFGKYIGMYIINSEHFKNKGSIDFIFIDYENHKAPTLKDFEKSKLLWLKKNDKKWIDVEFCGSIKTIEYDKSNKIDFFNFTRQNFLTIGNLQNLNTNKITFESNWRLVDFKDSQGAIEVFEEQRQEDIAEKSLSLISLADLLNKIGG